MRLALPLLILAAAAVGCSDSTTAPAVRPPSMYIVVGGSGSGNPPPPPLAATATFSTSSSTSLALSTPLSAPTFTIAAQSATSNATTNATATNTSVQVPAFFDLNATRDGGTVQFDPKNTGQPSRALPTVFFVPGPNGGTVAGTGTITLQFNNDVVTIDLASTVRGRASTITPSCGATVGGECATIRIENATMTSLTTGASHLVSGTLRVTRSTTPPPIG